MHRKATTQHQHTTHTTAPQRHASCQHHTTMCFRSQRLLVTITGAQPNGHTQRELVWREEQEKPDEQQRHESSRSLLQPMQPATAYTAHCNSYNTSNAPTFW